MMSHNTQSPFNYGLIGICISTLTLIFVIFNTLTHNRQLVKTLEQFEAFKVGGIENYENLKKLYSSDGFKAQQKQGIESAIQQTAGNTDTTNSVNPPHGQPGHKEDGATTAETTTKKLTLDQVTTVSKDAIIKGSKDAKIIILEYSDLQCPFCKRHFESGTLDSLLKRYEGKVSKTMKQFPLSFHPYAQKAGEGAYCFAQGDADKLFQFVGAVFAKDLNANGSDELIFSINKELGGNESTFKKCIDSGEFSQRVKDDMQEGSTLFGVTGTPGNVIINKETGEYTVLAGAYPSADFEKIIDGMLKK